VSTVGTIPPFRDVEPPIRRSGEGLTICRSLPQAEKSKNLQRSLEINALPFGVAFLYWNLGLLDCNARETKLSNIFDTGCSLEFCRRIFNRKFVQPERA
jgi:hypothetical protein